MKSFQWDGAEGLCVALFGVGFFALMAVYLTIAIIAGVLYQKVFPKKALLIIPLLPLPSLFFYGWLCLSVTDVKKVAHVDEEYYFNLQHIKDRNGKDRMVFYDNRGRFLHAVKFGKPDDTMMARKRVYRGRSWLLSWEWMEFDLVPKADHENYH